MINCPSCSREIPQDSRVCPYCAEAVGVEPAVPTVTAPPKAADRVAPSGSSSDAIDQARFTPGTMLTERYRIIGLLGKGGMGEVYRADDLTLRQSVALKFLPAALSKDSRRLERFHHEVRVARQVSHPNVCRVYDIAEADGQHFISMEYVDGEDLASVLRRMGRPSKDKAIQIARQLCAGLAAAHDKGVLHRDLKPHNVMIDGRGKVRVTDFGLAGFVEEFAGREVAAGTPAYMAPEQFAGREVSVKSDIYALGLVLFELFTGQRAFKGATREEIERQQAEQSPTSLSTAVEDIDPAVERIVLRCLESEPDARPSSALAVAAALPGGDPLAAALAAGETPSPEMVAAAGEPSGMTPPIGLACLGASLFGLLIITILAERASLFCQVPLEKPPAVLADRAEDIIRRLGYTDHPTDTAYGFAIDAAYLRYIDQTDRSPARWDVLAAGRPPAVYFWFRQSPRHLTPGVPFGGVSQGTPPSFTEGMVWVCLDQRGRLIAFAAVPPRVDAAVEQAQSPAWSVLFVDAGLELAHFTQTDPARTPPVYCNVRMAWEGSFPDQPEPSIRVEAGAYRGRPVYFEIIGPWSSPGLSSPDRARPGQSAYDQIIALLTIVVLIVGILFARRNLALGRGDRKGAKRLAFYFLGSFVLLWIFQGNHVPTLAGEWKLFVRTTGYALFWSAFVWLIYIALEPSVRRRWPDRIITWTRFLAGGFRDPLVGRDVLVGGLFGVAFLLLDQLGHVLPRWVGLPPPMPYVGSLSTLLPARYMVTESLSIQLGSVSYAMGLLLLFLSLRVMLRREQLAAGVCFLILTVAFSTFSAGGHSLYLDSLFSGLKAAMLILILMRLGLLALIVTLFIAYMLSQYPITWDFTAWQVGSSLFALLTCAALTVYGFYCSLAGQPLFKDDLLER